MGQVLSAGIGVGVLLLGTLLLARLFQHWARLDKDLALICGLSSCLVILIGIASAFLAIGQW
jgi:hypothetical protein